MPEPFISQSLQASSSKILLPTSAESDRLGGIRKAFLASRNGSQSFRTQLSDAVAGFVSESFESRRGWICIDTFLFRRLFARPTRRCEHEPTRDTLPSRHPDA